MEFIGTTIKHPSTTTARAKQRHHNRTTQGVMKSAVMLALAAALFATQSGTAIAQQPAKQPSPAQQAQSDFPPDYIDLSGETAKDSADDEPDYDRPWYKQFTILGMDITKVDIKTFAQKWTKRATRSKPIKSLQEVAARHTLRRFTSPQASRLRAKRCGASFLTKKIAS